MEQAIWIGLLTLFAAGLGTATGFGTSTLMLPVLAFFMPIHAALLFVGVIHLCGDIWKMALFRTGFDRKLVVGFGLAGIVASLAGASLSLHASELPLKRMLGIFLLIYVLFLFLKKEWRLAQNSGTVLCGGLLSGFFAGLFGVGGAVRGAFLSAFALPKEVYIFTSGLVAFFIDTARVSRYLGGGTRLSTELLVILAVCIPISLAGAFLAKRLLAGVDRRSFRTLVGFFLAMVGVLLVTGAGPS